ncbi:GAF and ANTAR domain-containing protein [Streptomyces sp. CB03911]|uniref:GAF and ANTAR domain-containing protein n=1 Tax=Streptomyces sp. CB03911 TaxID=1804758 RepID=UPI00093F24DA|nr:GAF and ANTAR domain-containing protein [Streptomyces sp. CB03911]OKI13363.1 hypothetical protein A6A07_15845 [Streptomyces sp. CB03911]
MISDLLARSLPLLRRRAGTLDLSALHEVGPRALGVDSLAVSLLTDPGRRELLWSSDALGRRFEDLEFVLGDGPGDDASSHGRPVLVPDLAGTRSARWPMLAAEATALPVRAVFCFPLCIGAIHLGTLTAVRRTSGPLTGAQTDDAFVLAAALTSLCLEVPDGDGHMPWEEEPPPLLRAVVHQATGMLSVQLAVPLPEALVRLRAHAYAAGRTLGDMAQDIVDRRARLGQNGREE